jgi:hypothetical protein
MNKKVTQLSDLSEGLQVLLKKMFDIVGAPYDLELTEGWYSKYQWTEEQEQEFKDFFMEFLTKNPLRKNVFHRHAYRNKREREKTWAQFNLMYGWLLKE